MLHLRCRCAASMTSLLSVNDIDVEEFIVVAFLAMCGEITDGVGFGFGEEEVGDIT